MATIGAGVTLKGFYFEDSMFTCVLASGITAADIGKAVSWDTGAANKVKLAADGDSICGRLETVENRVQEGVLVGTVAFRFSNTLPIKSGLAGDHVVTQGGLLIGAGAGEVKGVIAANFVAGTTLVRVCQIESLVATAMLI